MDDRKLSLVEAYLAMYYFISAYWEQGGRIDESLGILLNDVTPEKVVDDELETLDPGSWSAWLDAVQAALEKGLPAGS